MPNIRVVLVGTSHPGNIGAAARAMKTMGLTQLSLVAPQTFPNAQATARAAGADDILEAAQVFATLTEAVADCGLVIGSSARLRHLAWPQMNARKAGMLAVTWAATSTVAFVFGSERTGLTNAELDHCHCLVNIPTRSDFSSLNLAAAVQVIAYEVHMAAQASGEQGSTETKGTAGSHGKTGASAPHVPAPALEMERFYTHIGQALADIGFMDPTRPRLLIRRLRRLFNRAQPDVVEVNLLRGILTTIQRLAKR
ncbi:tRNA (cytidine/uridine-2'-O-)-methyltransferase TrmJ [Gammaproteobacteria bacterium]